jgi:hypothetical protein
MWSDADFLDCTLRECRASKAESRTLEEWAPSLMLNLMLYSLSVLPRPLFRSYSSKVRHDWEKGQLWTAFLSEGTDAVV